MTNLKLLRDNRDQFSFFKSSEVSNNRGNGSCPAKAQCATFPCVWCTLQFSALTIQTHLARANFQSTLEPYLTVNNMMSLMISVPIKHLGGHTNSSITALPISSEMMTVAASLARQSCCWLSSSPLWESENRYQSCPATRTNYCLTVYKYVCASKCRVNRATFCWIQICK